MNGTNDEMRPLGDLTVRDVARLVGERRSRTVKFQDNSREVLVVAFGMAYAHRVLEDLQRELLSPTAGHAGDVDAVSLQSAAQYPITVSDILAVKGREVHTIDADAKLAAAACRMCEQNVGALVICNDRAGVAGLLSERDLLRATANGQNFERTRVRQAMSVDLVLGAPHDRIEEVMQRMTYHRVRHLPVVDAGQLVGLVSIGDVVKALLHEVTVENDQLRRYVRGEATLATPLA